MSKMFFLLFFVILGVLAFLVFIIPDYRALQQTKTEIVALEQNVEIIKNLELSRDALNKQKLSISRNNMERLDRIVPSSPDNIRLIIELDELAKRNGLTMLTNISYDPMTRDLPAGQTEDVLSNYRSFEMEFETAGQYAQFLIFLEEVEKNLRLVDITSIELKNAQTQDNTPSTRQTFSVTLQAYWLSETNI